MPHLNKIIQNLIRRPVYSVASIIGMAIAFASVMAYREPLGREVFTLTFFVVMTIVLMTVGGQSWRAQERIRWRR